MQRSIISVAIVDDVVDFIFVSPSLLLAIYFKQCKRAHREMDAQIQQFLFNVSIRHNGKVAR